MQFDYLIKILIIEKTILVFIQNFNMLFINTKENQLTLTADKTKKRRGLSKITSLLIFQPNQNKIFISFESIIMD